MSLFIMLGMCLSILFLMPLMLQPLSLGLCIMLLTGSLCLLSSLSASSWYAYILFLVFVGGLLVMFAYVAVLAPNTFFLNFKPMIWMFMVFATSLIIMSNFFSKNPLSITPPSSQASSLLDASSTGASLIFTNSTSIMIALGTILLIALLAVVKICYYQQGPLRAYSHFPK
uniref:NADH_dehydrogenase_subunit_6 n=1 Tax=Lepetodrilus nux TaxID=505977 RepID=A0A0U4W6X3_9VEST|nr:NADH_dehydrogenase_subunit_6 [Lepetodrilus nux]